jgi:hypothetical protein
MGQAVDIPLVFGAGHYIVMEQFDSFFCREAGVVADGAGKFESGFVMTLLKAPRTVGGKVLPAGTFAAYADGDDNAVILWERIDARVKGAKRTFTVRDTQVHSAKLTLGFAATNPQIQTLYSLLAARGIIQR